MASSLRIILMRLHGFEYDSNAFKNSDHSKRSFKHIELSSSLTSFNLVQPCLTMFDVSLSTCEHLRHHGDCVYCVRHHLHLPAVWEWKLPSFRSRDFVQPLPSWSVPERDSQSFVQPLPSWSVPRCGGRKSLQNVSSGYKHSTFGIGLHFRLWL